MLGGLNGWHAVILLVIILLLFGAPKLPALARSLGQSLKIFKSEVKTTDAAATGSTSTTTADTNSTGTANPAAGPADPGDQTKP